MEGGIWSTFCFAFSSWDCRLWMVLQYCDVSGVDWDAPAPHRRQRWDWSGGGGGGSPHRVPAAAGAWAAAAREEIDCWYSLNF